MSAQRLSALESAFLGLESRDVPFVYASVLEFEHPIAAGALREHLAAALAEVPRYRSHVARTRLGRRVWIEGEIDFTRHVRTAAVASPGGTRELEQLVAQLLESELPRGRPPWRMWTVQGLADGRGAVIALVHHSLVDGLGGFRLLEHILGAPPPPPRALRRRARPRLLAWRNVVALAQLLRDGLRPATRVGINPRHTGRHRAVASHTAALADIHRIERVYGATNNDVVLATVAGALRRMLIRRGLDPRTLTDVRAMVPVGRPGDDPHAMAGNRVVLLLAPLPVDSASPAERLLRVASATRRLKSGHTIGGGDLLVALSQATTPALLGNVLRLALRMRAFNVLVTNVPGPRQSLSLLGTRLRRIVPIVNLWPHQAIGIAIASYAGTLTFGLQSDRAVVPEAELLALRDDIALSLAELVEAAQHEHAA